MSFRSIVGGLFVGLMVPFMFVAGSRELSARNRNLLYSFLAILYLFLITYCWFREGVEYVVGLSLAGAIWLRLWYSDVKRFRQEEELLSVSTINKKRPPTFKDALSESENAVGSIIVSDKSNEGLPIYFTNSKDDFKIKFALCSLRVWILIFLGTYLPWDYSYFIFVRIVATSIALVLLEVSYKLSRLFCGAFILMLIIFNPFFPFRFDREIWQVLDIAVILLLASFYFKVKFAQKKLASNVSNIK